jgi:hypothetical protein
MHGYPTLGEAFHEASLAAPGNPLHMRGSLPPTFIGYGRATEGNASLIAREGRPFEGLRTFVRDP